MGKLTCQATVRLLRKLQAENEIHKYAAEYPQKLSPAESVRRGVPTLAPGKYQPLTPMLAERFRFCSDWNNAFIGMTWSGIAALERAAKSRKVRSEVRTRREYWEGSAPALYPDEQLSFLGFDLVDGAAIYLIWNGKQEPSIAWYEAQHEDTFRNLNGLLKHLVGEA